MLKLNLTKSLFMPMPHVVVNDSGERSETSSADESSLNPSSQPNQTTSHPTSIGSIPPIAYSTALQRKVNQMTCLKNSSKNSQFQWCIQQPRTQPR